MRVSKRSKCLHAQKKAAVTVQTIKLPDGAHYGRVVRDEAGRVIAVVQAKDSKDRPDLLAIREINTGAYCFEAAFLRQGLTKIPKSPVTGEIYLTDLIHIARQQGRGVEALITRTGRRFWGLTAGPNWPGPPRPSSAGSTPATWTRGSASSTRRPPISSRW